MYLPCLPGPLATLKIEQVGEAIVFKKLHVQISVLSLGNVQDLNVETDEKG